MLDAKTAEMDALYATLPALNCQRRCQKFCGPVLMSHLEWVRVQRTLGYRPQSPSRANNVRQLTCPMLRKSTGECRVYQVRPMICRLFGLTEELKCPHGCQPERWLTKEEAYWYLGEAGRIGGEQNA